MITPAQRALIRAAQRELASMEPAMRRAFMRAVAELLRTVPPSVLAERIASGVPASDLLPKRALDRAFTFVQREMRDDAARGFMVNTKLFAGGQGLSGIAFNTLSPRVLAGIARMEDFILRQMKADVRESVRLAVEAGLKAGDAPATIARGIRHVVGLAPNQQQYVMNYWNKLELVAAGKSDWKSNKLRDKRFDATIEKALREGKGLPTATIEKMVEAYARKYEAWHAETVARTATLNAYRAGQHASIEAAVEMDIMLPQDMIKIWTTVGDDRVRDEHAAMDGEEVPYDQAFSNGLTIPSEWNCRCLVLYEYRPPGSRSREEALRLLRERDKGRITAEDA